MSRPVVPRPLRNVRKSPFALTLSVMATKTVVHRDVWGHEREGYVDQREVAYAAAKPAMAASAPSPWVWLEERLGPMGSAAGIVWGVQVLTSHVSHWDAVWETPGPLEVSAIGILIWLHAKWRRSVRLR